MSFRKKSYPTRNKRKESDSLHMNSNPKTNHLVLERASSFTSKGVVTLEAAVVIPIFFFALLCMIYLFEVMTIQTSIRSGLHNIGRELAEEAYLSPIISTKDMEERMITFLGEEYLDKSIIVDGSKGLDCSNSKSNIRTAVMDLNVRYQVEIPVLLFRIPIRTYEERLRVKGWSGYEESGNDSAEDDLVYVTDYGVVYHKSLLCKHLDLSIRPITKSALFLERNESGGIYDPCAKCRNLAEGIVVYITDYGNSYHTTLDCSGLKRSIRVVRISELNGLGGCSKCAR